jgi:hypothetical protein
MDKQELIEKVLDLIQTDPDPAGETSLGEWIENGDTDDMTPEEIAAEWDSLPSKETDI